MCADPRASALIAMAEVRRQELVKQVEQFRQTELASSSASSTQRRRIDLRRAVAMLSCRSRSTRWLPGLSRPIELDPATRSKW